VTVDEQKKAAAKAALDYVKPGMKLGLGTGSTARHFIELIGEKVKAGLDVACVPTSEETRREAESLQIPLTTLDAHPFLDLTVDGADEFDRDFNVLKGGGGALVREKIVASSSRHMVVIADQSKKVEKLGAFPLPIEVVPFGIKATAWKIEHTFRVVGIKNSKMVVRMHDGKPFRTDGGHAILDCALEQIPDAKRLADALSIVPGVVDHGLFIGICGVILMGTPKGVTTFKRK
jgi:ribose 5-phosphate isomerase A